MKVSQKLLRNISKHLRRCCFKRQKATSNPRVMNHMQEIIDFIKELVDEGYAYESDGDVYFRTRQFNGYGKLSHQSLDDLKVGARIEAGSKRKTP